MKKTVSICLILAVLLCLVTMYGCEKPVTNTTAPTADASETPAATPTDNNYTPSKNPPVVSPLMATSALKDGYTLVPTKYGMTGIDTASAFVLTTPAAAALEDIVAMLSIDGQPAPDIAQKSETEFTVTPAATLLPNSLYMFRLRRDFGTDVTWAFQTAVKFQITSSYPYNEASNVPKNTGIEVTFSGEGYGNIDPYFNISPNVKGSFEYHKKTAVFVPESLAYKTIYTVTIKAGIKFDGTGEILKDDYVFAFETEAEPGHKPPKFETYLDFNNKYAVLPTIEAPTVEFWIYHEYGTEMPDSKVNVYKFSSSESAISAVKQFASTPYWSIYNREDRFIDTNGMSNIMSFDTKRNYDRNNYCLTLLDKLSQGFYLLEATLENSRDQMILQINDLPLQVVGDDDKTIIWVNDISTGKASANAEVRDVKNNKTYKTDASGIVVVERALSTDDWDQIDVTSADGKVCVYLYSRQQYFYYGRWGYSNSANESYWTVMQLDRTLFKRDDTVSFFGFAQARKNNAKIENVTAVLTQGYRHYYDYGFGINFNSARDILLKQTVPVRNCAYSDKIKLPNLDSGSYCITVYSGDTVLGSTYFTVQDYVKPPYKIELEAEKAAVFSGETATFTAKASFFEGTPVSDLSVSYNLWGYMLNTIGNGQAQTDINGEVKISQKIIPTGDAQGEAGLYCSIEATLPEIGYTVKSANNRVFINDIDVKTKANRTGANATLAVDVNTITLDRLNDGTAKDYYDYLDKPVANKSISVDINRVYYVKRESGTFYDYIEKKNVTTYRYNRMEEKINSFFMTTDSDGKAANNFTVPDRENESYYAIITCIDGNGRNIKLTEYIGRDYSFYWENASYNDLYLDVAKEESYFLGDDVNLTLKRGTDTVTNGGILFVNMQNGIKNYQVGMNPYSFKFTQEEVPNVWVYAYYFDGLKYQSTYRMNVNIRYNNAERLLDLETVADKETYKPGEMCTVTVTARDIDGNAKEANVNISIVDEALFALMDYGFYTLNDLYRDLNPGLRLASTSHGAFDSYSIGYTGSGKNMVEEYADSAAPAYAPPMASPEPEIDRGGGASDTYLREIFKDTAFFSTMRTDKSGKAVYTFKLPDNITSWRLSVSGISDDLYASSITQNIIVTNPMFINYTLNDEFLVGDIPTIGVNAYGTSLTGAETVEFEVWDESNPDSKYTAKGVAFERVNIPLWVMKNEGENALVVKATVSNGTSDAVKHQYQVLKSYREIDAAVYYDVTTSTVFEVGKGGLTNITFTDRSRGAFLRELLWFRYVYGDRIEKLLVRREANKLLAKYFPDLKLYGCDDSFDLKQYQRNNGGIAILPYAESDLETTVKLLPYIIDEVNLNTLKSYLYNIYEGDGSDNKMCALYGLAMLNEPVLLDLYNYSMLDNLSVKDLVYIALGFYALGETGVASSIYDNGIAPKLERLDPYYRIYTGADNDDILEATSAASLLATKLDKPEKDGLYGYCIKNFTTDILISIEKLSHIEHEIAKRTDVSGSVTYTLFGEEFTREFANGGCYTLSIPAQSIGEFKLLDVKGDVGAVSVFKMPMTEIGEIDDDITVSRSFYKGTNGKVATATFAQGDLVRVELRIDYTAKALDGSYCVTDYLPSGLEFAPNSAKIEGASRFGYGCNCYCTVEGQKVTFYDYNSRFYKDRTYYYYARVICPGTYKAEGPLVQNLTAKDCYTVGADTTITIK